MTFEKAAPILVKTLDEKPVDLLDLYQGHVVLVLFYNNKCLGCTGRAIPLAYEYQQSFAGLKVVGIHSNFGGEVINKGDILSIFTVDELPFPIFIDDDHRMYDQFNCEGTPHWVLISKEGEVFRSIFGSQRGTQNRMLYALEEVLAL